MQCRAQYLPLASICIQLSVRSHHPGKYLTLNCLDCWSAPAVVYTSASAVYDLSYPATSVLTDTRDDAYVAGTSHWVDNQINAEFIIDLGCTALINYIQIRNSGLWNLGGVKKFSIYIALNQGGPWTRSINGHIFEDPRYKTAAQKPKKYLPIIAIAKYIKFVSEEFYGSGASLQFLEAVSNYYGAHHSSKYALTFSNCDSFNILETWSMFTYVIFLPFSLIYKDLLSGQTTGSLQMGTYLITWLLILAAIPK